MQFQSYKIADLIPASYNPRKKLKPGDKEYEKIKNSIKEFGYVEPIIINSDMTIIGGHQRATVLADLGYTEVECIVVDIDKTKALLGWKPPFSVDEGLRQTAAHWIQSRSHSRD